MSGQFLGWTMTVWGSVIDPALAKVYNVPVLEDTLPPLYPSDDTPTTTVATPEGTTTKTHPKPTAHLPSDHVEAPGETHLPAFPGSSNNTDTKPVEDVASPVETTTAVTGTSTPTADEGWFSDMSNLVTNQAWFFIALGAVLLFASGAGLYFWRRSVRRRRDYTSLPDGDDLAMSSIGGVGSGPRSKELYAAFDEVEDDEDADEQTGLRRVPGESPVGLGYHSGFLDDDDPASAAGPPTRYKDEPGPLERAAERSHSPDSGNSGSWEHASQEHAPNS